MSYTDFSYWKCIHGVGAELKAWIV